MVLTGQQKINNKHTKKYSVMKKKLYYATAIIACSLFPGPLFAQLTDITGNGGTKKSPVPSGKN